MRPIKLMCYHYSLSADGEVIERRFTANFKPDYYFKKVDHVDGFSHRAMPIITAEEPESIDNVGSTYQLKWSSELGFILYWF